jgi:cell division protein FtsQ
MSAVTVGIDPRIRARRVAVMRADGRRRLRLLLAVVASLAAIGAGWSLTRSPVLDVDEVRITGAEGPNAALIRDLAGVSEGVALVDVDTGAIENRLEGLPWVREVDVEKQWPNTITVQVTERTAVAVVPSGTGWARLDAEGVVMGRESSPDPAATEGLPVISVPLSVAVGDVHLEAAPGLAVISALTADLEPWVRAVTVDGDRVGLDLMGRARVSLGPAVRLDDKVTAIRAVLAGVDLSCITDIDVAAADQTTVRRDPLCEATARATVSDA